MSCENCVCLVYEVLKITGFKFQFTNIGDTCSSVLPIERGIPQETKSGPFLVKIIKNNVCNSSQFLKLYLNADDTFYFCSLPNIQELIGKLNIELFKSNRWFADNQLIINESNTKLMVFHLSNKLVPTVHPQI